MPPVAEGRASGFVKSKTFQCIKMPKYGSMLSDYQLGEGKQDCVTCACGSPQGVRFACNIKQVSGLRFG